MSDFNQMKDRVTASMDRLLRSIDRALHENETRNSRTGSPEMTTFTMMVDRAVLHGKTREEAIADCKRTHPKAFQAHVAALGDPSPSPTQ